MKYTKKPDTYEVVWEFDGTQQNIDDLNTISGYVTQLPPLPVPGWPPEYPMYELKDDGFCLAVYEGHSGSWTRAREYVYTEDDVLIERVVYNIHGDRSIVSPEVLSNEFDEVGE